MCTFSRKERIQKKAAGLLKLKHTNNSAQNPSFFFPLTCSQKEWEISCSKCVQQSLKTAEAQGAYRFQLKSKFIFFPHTVAGSLKRSRNVHLLTGCDVAHDGNRKTMKINLRMKQISESQTRQFVISNQKTFKERASMLSFGNFFFQESLSDELVAPKQFAKNIWCEESGCTTFQSCFNRYRQEVNKIVKG